MEEGRQLSEADVRAFVEADYPRVVNAVALVTGDVGRAEESVQEAIVKAWVRLERGEAIDSLPNWVTAVALNHARSTWRRLAAERRLQRSLGARGDVAGPSGDPVDVERALARLPRRQREIAVLRYFLDMDTKEVASTLGISDGTVKSSLARARSALAESLRMDDLEEIPDAQP